MPTAMFEHHDKKRRGQLNTDYALSYDNAVAGRLLVDTLMDAYAFFESCDPSLVKRDADNQISGFPLPPLPFAGGYVRLHPDWPSHEHVDSEIRNRTRSALPKGRDRQIRGLLSVGGTVVQLAAITELLFIGDDEEPWHGWWTLCQDDAQDYRAQREQT